MADLVAEVAEHGAVGLVQAARASARGEPVGLVQVKRDHAVRVSGRDRSRARLDSSSNARPPERSCQPTIGSPRSSETRTSSLRLAASAATKPPSPSSSSSLGASARERAARAKLAALGAPSSCTRRARRSRSAARAAALAVLAGCASARAQTTTIVRAEGSIRARSRSAADAALERHQAGAHGQATRASAGGERLSRPAQSNSTRPKG